MPIAHLAIRVMHISLSNSTPCDGNVKQFYCSDIEEIQIEGPNHNLFLSKIKAVPLKLNAPFPA